MRHRKAGRKLGRITSHRIAMMRNLVTSVLEHERIVTTVPRAKEAQGVVDHMITLGKRGDLHAKRQALSYLHSRNVVAKLFDSLSKQYAERHGGYTRIIRTGVRQGDAAPMAILELVDYKDEPAKPEAAKAE